MAANEETDAEDEDNEKESVSFEEREESNSGLSSEESEVNDTAEETYNNVFFLKTFILLCRCHYREYIRYSR